MVEDELSQSDGVRDDSRKSLGGDPVPSGLRRGEESVGAAAAEELFQLISQDSGKVGQAKALKQLRDEDVQSRARLSGDESLSQRGAQRRGDEDVINHVQNSVHGDVIGGGDSSVVDKDAVHRPGDGQLLTVQSCELAVTKSSGRNHSSSNVVEQDLTKADGVSEKGVDSPLAESSPRLLGRGEDGVLIITLKEIADGHLGGLKGGDEGVQVERLSDLEEVHHHLGRERSGLRLLDSASGSLLDLDGLFLLEHGRASSSDTAGRVNTGSLAAGGDGGREKDRVDDVDDAVGGVSVGGEDVGVIDHDASPLAAVPDVDDQGVTLQSGQRLTISQGRGRVESRHDVVPQDPVELGHIDRRTSRHEFTNGFIGRGEEGEWAGALKELQKLGVDQGKQLVEVEFSSEVGNKQGLGRAHVVLPFGFLTSRK